MLRVLLIDDNPDDRLLIKRELDREFSDSEIQSVTDAVGLEHALTKGEFDIANHRSSASVER